LFEELERAVLEGNAEETERLVKALLEKGVNPLEIIDKGCVPGIERAGELFDAEEFYLPELIIAGDAMKRAMAVLEPELKKSDLGRKSLGKVVIGTVEGDMHDIGKSIVASMLSGAGFDVLDLGVDVSIERFLEEARETEADIVGLSALLTSTVAKQEEFLRVLESQGLRQRFRVMVGGAPVTEEWAIRMGADGYAEDAVSAVRLARSLVAKE
jgi:corrinoid protein of di/trimethylamine methyltransferase